MAAILAFAHTYQSSPNPNIAHATFLSALLSAVGSAISLVCWLSWASAVNSRELGSSANGLTVATYAHSASTFLLISGMVGLLVGLAIWLYGRVQQKGGSLMSGQPHYHSAPAHYGNNDQQQLHQPLTQH